jgi:hypothetical protein
MSVNAMKMIGQKKRTPKKVEEVAVSGGRKEKRNFIWRL